jgi:hypothetical protein
VSASILRQIRAAALGIRSEEARFFRRGFDSDSASTRQHLEQIGEFFIYGYNQTLASAGVQALSAKLDGVPRYFRGFAFEGAAMASHLLDVLTLTRRRWQELHDSVGDRYLYLLYIGMGWVWARLPLPLPWALGRCHPLYGWLAIDGLGFHAGYFDTANSVEGRKYPRRVVGYSRNAFDQGLGRSLWFSCGARPGAISSAIQQFPPARHADLWSGIGLACAYAGGAPDDDLVSLLTFSGAFRPALAQGVAFAAEARLRARDVAPWTAAACARICFCSVEDAALRTRRTRESLPLRSNVHVYEVWRSILQASFVESPTTSEAKGVSSHGTSSGRRVEPDRQADTVRSV